MVGYIAEVQPTLHRGRPVLNFVPTATVRVCVIVISAPPRARAPATVTVRKRTANELGEKPFKHKSSSAGNVLPSESKSSCGYFFFRFYSVNIVSVFIILFDLHVTLSSIIVIAVPARPLEFVHDKSRPRAQRGRYVSVQVIHFWSIPFVHHNCFICLCPTMAVEQPF